MDDARSLLGFVSSAVSKIVKRDKKPKDLATSIDSIVPSLSASIQSLLLSPTAAAAASASIAAPTGSSSGPSSGNNSTTPSNSNSSASTPSHAAAAAAITTSTGSLTSASSSASIPASSSSSTSSVFDFSSAAVAASNNNSNGSTTTTDDDRCVPLSPSSSNALTSDLDQVVCLLYGDTSEGTSMVKEPDPRVAKEMVDLLLDLDLLRRLLFNLRWLEFEARKSVTRVFEFCLTSAAHRDAITQYFEQRRDLLVALVRGYEEKDVSVALSCDSILRACVGRTDSYLAWLVLNHTDPPLIPLFFRYIELPNFDISSHAFATFKMLLTEHMDVASDYVRENYAEFFRGYTTLLQSDNFLCKVQSFNFLSELLMKRDNQDVMMMYVNDPENLKVAMIALRTGASNKAVQLAVFHVLKIFVPNPFKADSIIKILSQNKRNFVNFLTQFEKDSQDEVLLSHKEEMLQALMQLPDQV